MTHNVRFLASASVLAATAFAASPAFAAGTTAGTPVNNTVTLNYQVGGVNQGEVTATDSFTVDRKVNLTVVATDTSTTTVSPGQTAAVTAFTVTNGSNAPLDLGLAATQLSGGSAPHGTDNFDVSNVKVYRDVNNNGAYDSATDVEVSYLDEVAADGSVQVLIVADVPLGRSTGDVAGVRLTATAREANGAGAQGAVVTQTAGANTAQMDTVFADTNSAGNTARDGAHWGEDDYTVLAALLTASKTSRVISDPLNLTTNPKMIPGATVEYCIAVSNASGSATATGVGITDELPAQTTYDSGFGILVNGTVTGSTCNADGTAGGSYAGGTVSVTLGTITGGTTRTVVFRVTVN